MPSQKCDSLWKHISSTILVIVNVKNRNENVNKDNNWLELTICFAFELINVN